MTSSDVWQRYPYEEGAGDARGDVVTGVLERERSRLQRELSVARDRLERTESGSGFVQPYSYPDISTVFNNNTQSPDINQITPHHPLYEQLSETPSVVESEVEFQITGVELLAKIRLQLKRARKELRPAISNPTVRVSDMLMKDTERDLSELRYICEKQETMISSLSNRLQEEEEEKLSVMKRLKEMITNTGECLTTVRQEAADRELKMNELVEENQMLRTQQHRSLSPSIAPVPMTAVRPTGLETAVSRQGIQSAQREKAERELHHIRSRISSLQEVIDSQHTKVSPSRSKASDHYLNRYQRPHPTPRFGDGTPFQKKHTNDPFLVLSP